MKVICFGDSNTYGYDPHSVFGDCFPAGSRWMDIVAKKTGWEFENQGMNGRKIPRAPINIAEDADFLIVMLGTNNILQGNNVQTITDRMENFLTSLQFDRNKIIMIAPPVLQLGDWVPRQELVEVSVQLIPSYKALAEKLGVGFADASLWNVQLIDDGVHFTEAGHKAFAAGLYEFLTKGE